MNRKINKLTAINTLKNDLVKFILDLSYKYNTRFEAFLEWEWGILNEFYIFVSNKLNSNKYDYHKFNKEDLVYIDQQHKDFIIVPIDKAASNYAVIRKLFYTNEITTELNNSKYFGKSKLGQNAITNKFNAYIK